MRSIISLRSNITRRKANITEAHFLTECASMQCFLFWNRPISPSRRKRNGGGLLFVIVDIAFLVQLPQTTELILGDGTGGVGTLQRVHLAVGEDG